MRNARKNGIFSFFELHLKKELIKLIERGPLARLKGRRQGKENGNRVKRFLAMFHE